jgi:predicted dehydrogenase
MRTRPVMAAMKRLVDAGELGEIYRVSLVASNWYRTQSYYNSGSWRGTWDGEGGGVLINQAPHSLDLFQFIGGMPHRIRAIIGTRLHDIEVENTAHILLEYAGGKMGYIYASTAEAPGVEEFSIAGTRGCLVAAEGKLRFARLAQPLDEHLRTAPGVWDTLPSQWEEVPAAGGSDDGKHIHVLRNFVDHILDGAPLIAPGENAINELELSNAAYIAGYKNKAVELPVDAAEMNGLLSKLIRERSTGRGGNLRGKARRELKRLLKQ